MLNYKIILVIKPQNNIGNGFSMPTPIANLTQQNNNNVNGQSSINSGFQSPINYNINTPQSPLGNYSGIITITNAFTPTATDVNAITPTTKLPFYWSNIHKNSNNQNNSNNQMGNINMENDPLAPHNIPPFLPQQNNIKIITLIHKRHHMGSLVYLFYLQNIYNVFFFCQIGFICLHQICK